MKRQKYLVAALAAALLLVGCIFALGASVRAESADYISFDEIEYVRPDTALLAEKVDTVVAALETGRRAGRIIELLEDCYREFYNYSTMYTVAEIRYLSDLTDEFYEQEYALCGAGYSGAQQQMERLYRACAASKLAERLERDFFWEGFAAEYGGDSGLRYSDEAVALMQRESELLSRYYALSAAPVLEFDGVQTDYAEYLASAEGYDYYAAHIEYCRQYNARFAELYIELVKTRRALAAELGYESYEQMQYEYFVRDYTPDEAAAFLEDIKSFVVPLYEEVMAASPYARIEYRYMSAERLLELVGAVTDKLGGAAAEAFEFMLEYGLYNVDYDERKANLSFTVYLDSYDEPYIFVSPYGDTEDVLSLSHEFGHYLDSYVNYNATESLDLCEFFSQAMEYLALVQGEGVIDGEELASLRLIKLLDTLDLYTAQGAYAEFESRVYALGESELTAENINALALETARDYGCVVSEEDADYYELGWFEVTHFFEAPFYVISYPVSNDAAMQIYELELAEAGAGWEKYGELLPRSSEGLIESLESVGLSGPFAGGRVERTAKNMRELLREEALAA